MSNWFEVTVKIRGIASSIDEAKHGVHRSLVDLAYFSEKNVTIIKAKEIPEPK